MLVMNTEACKPFCFHPGSIVTALVLTAQRAAAAGREWFLGVGHCSKLGLPTAATRGHEDTTVLRHGFALCPRLTPQETVSIFKHGCIDRDSAQRYIYIYIYYVYVYIYTQIECCVRLKTTRVRLVLGLDGFRGLGRGKCPDPVFRSSDLQVPRARKRFRA